MQQHCGADADGASLDGRDQRTARLGERLQEAAAKTGRPVATYALFMIVTGETDAEAEAKWALYKQGADTEALAWMVTQATAGLSTLRMAMSDAHGVRWLVGYAPDGTPALRSFDGTTWRTPLTALAAVSSTLFTRPPNTGDCAKVAILMPGGRASIP